MNGEHVMTLDNPAGLLLTPELLQKIGVSTGDQIQISVNEHSLTVRPLTEAERARKIAAATRDIFDRRREAYLELAKGHE